MSISLQKVEQRISYLYKMDIGKRFLQETLPTIFTMSDCKDAALLGYSFQTIDDPEVLRNIIASSSIDTQQLFASYWGVAFPDLVETTTDGLLFDKSLATLWLKN